MPHPRFSGEEIDRRGEEIYEQHLRPMIETEENIGKIIAIDIETGEYAIDSDVLAACRRLLAAHPGAAISTRRIGFNAVYAVALSWERRS